MFESAWRLLEPDIPCAASACETFEPSATSCVQLFAELNEEDDDDEEDEEDDDDDDEELVVELCEAVVVGGADDLDPPQPAASATSVVTEAIANAFLMPNPPVVACAGEPTA